jgi:hypothetical protein
MAIELEDGSGGGSGITRVPGETRLSTQIVGNGRINVVQGVVGNGVKDRQVTLQAIPDPGYKFDRWVITKTAPPVPTSGGGTPSDPEIIRGPINEPREEERDSDAIRIIEDFGDISIF